MTAPFELENRRKPSCSVSSPSLVKFQTRRTVQLYLHRAEWPSSFSCYTQRWQKGTRSRGWPWRTGGSGECLYSHVTWLICPVWCFDAVHDKLSFPKVSSCYQTHANRSEGLKGGVWCVAIMAASLTWTYIDVYLYCTVGDNFISGICLLSITFWLFFSCRVIPTIPIKMKTKIRV